MTTYIEYDLEDGITLLIETVEKTSGVTKASKVGNVIASVGQKFEDAFTGVKKSAMVLCHQLEELQADEVEVTFGLKATADAGNFAIGQVGAEANYMVKLKWNNNKDEGIASKGA